VLSAIIHTLSRSVLRQSLTIVLRLMLTGEAARADSSAHRLWDGWHTSGSKISYQVANDRVQEIINLDPGCDPGAGLTPLSGRIVRVEFNPDAISIRGIVAEPSRGNRFYVNVDWPSLDLPGMGMVDLEWIIHGLQTFLRPHKQVDGDARVCGATGRVLHLSIIRRVQTVQPNVNPAGPPISVPPARATSGSGATIVEMISDGGAFRVPVTINGVLTLKFIVDSGASDVLIPADVVLTLVRTGTIDEADFLGEQTYRMADGSKLPSKRFVIRSLKVGDKVLEKVNGSIAPVEGSLLLGQSFLSRFGSWSIDNKKGALILN
jgi:predicted aspartyl protease